MAEKLIKVEYVGRLEFIFDYNGKRFAFSRRNRILTMPVAAYAYAVANSGFAANDIIPYDESAEFIKIIAGLKEKIEELGGDPRTKEEKEKEAEEQKAKAKKEKEEKKKKEKEEKEAKEKAKKKEKERKAKEEKKKKANAEKEEKKAKEADKGEEK